MNPVYQRLIEIALELGQKQPVPNTYFQELLSLSSGRISQICDPDSIDKIGTKGLSNLATLGYNPKWVNNGHPNKKYLTNRTKSAEKNDPENPSTVTLKPKTNREKLLDLLAERAAKLNETGIALLAGEAKGLAESHPLPSSETAKLSQ